MRTITEEQAFIEAINANAGQGDRFVEKVYADWLEERGDPRAEGWRVLLEDGKRPTMTWHDELWDWLPEGYHSRRICDCDLPTPIWDLTRNSTRYESFFSAMDDAAISWVRCYRDPDFS